LYGDQTLILAEEEVKKFDAWMDGWMDKKQAEFGMMGMIRRRSKGQCQL
jgi:hypothetical protein